MMRIHKILTIGLLAGALGLGACQKEYETEYIENYEMSGQWFVQTYYGGTTAEDVVLGYEQIVTSNTVAANGSQILIDDKGHIWPFKVKANVNGMSFSVENGENIVEDSAFVSIRNGTIIKDGAKSLATNTTVDSIYFEAEFSDDPGETYIIAGHYRTGFEEDEP